MGIYLHRSTGELAVNSDSYIGHRVHLHNTALGQAILAHLPAERVEEIVDRYGLPASTENTITEGIDALRAGWTAFAKTTSRTTTRPVSRGFAALRRRLRTTRVRWRAPSVSPVPPVDSRASDTRKSFPEAQERGQRHRTQYQLHVRARSLSPGSRGLFTFLAKLERRWTRSSNTEKVSDLRRSPPHRYSSVVHLFWRYPRELVDIIDSTNQGVRSHATGTYSPVIRDIFR